MLIRNGVPLPPSLHGGVVAMAQGASQGAYASALSDDGLMDGHVRYVRPQRTNVNNADNVRANFYTSGMSGQNTGEALLAMKKRTGMSLDAIAQAAGYKGRSSVQNFFTSNYDKPLDTDVATKLAAALEGKGKPAIDRGEIFALTGVFESNATVLKFEGASDVTLRRDLPIYGTSLGAPQEFDGKAIEQTMLNSGNVIEYYARPTVLNGQKFAYGLYVQGSSMAPRFEEGEAIFASDSRYTRPPRIGDDVIVYILDPEEHDDGERACAVLVKRLVRRTADYVELQQFNPPEIFKISNNVIRRIDRVYPWGELLS